MAIPSEPAGPAPEPRGLGYPDQVIEVLRERLAHEATPGLPAVPFAQLERRQARARNGWPAAVTVLQALILEEDCAACLAVAPAPMSRVCVEPGCDGQGRRLTPTGRTLLDFVARRGGAR